MSDQHKEFQSSTIKAKMVRHQGCRVELEIDVEPAAVEAAYQRAIKAVNKEVSFPGFRKGRAPVALIEQRWQKEINRQWQELVASTAVSEALKLIELEPRTKESIFKLDMPTCERHGRAQVHMEFESAPQVPKIDLEGVVFKKLDVPVVSDRQVNHMMHALCIEKADLQEVGGRAVQEGDYVVLELELFNGEQSAKLLEDKIWEVSSEFMPAWILRTVVGMEVGQTQEVTCELDDALILSVKEGAPLPHCRVTVSRILGGELTALDENLAKQHGCSSVEELRTGVRKHLEIARERQIQEDLNEQILEEVLTRHDFDVPLSLYQTAAKRMADQQLKALKREADEGLVEEQVESIQKQAEESVKRSLRRYFITREVAERYNLSVNREEITFEMFREQIERRPADSSETEEEGIKRIYSHILQRKALEQLAILAHVE